MERDENRYHPVVSDQTALTIAKLLVENVISRHGVPVELLSDRGSAFLSHLLQEVSVVGDPSSQYHCLPPTDMLAKRVERSGRDWDTQIPYVLFAYRASLQESTGESPFFLMHGRDPRLPTELLMDLPSTRQFIDLDTYKGEVAARFQNAWEVAQAHVKKAQKRQKTAYDRQAKTPTYQAGERVFIYMPAAKATKAYKFARPFHGPYRITAVHETGIEVRPVDRPQEGSIRVALNRVRRCPEQIPDTFWPRKSQAKVLQSKTPPVAKCERRQSATTDHQDIAHSVWKGRLRNRLG